MPLTLNTKTKESEKEKLLTSIPPDSISEVILGLIKANQEEE